MNKKASTFIIIITVFLLIGCAVTIPPPFPVQQRIECLIAPLEDLTGIYKAVKPSFETILTSKMMEDYAQHIDKGPTQGYKKKTILTNVFIPLIISLEIDSSTENDIVETFGKSSNADLLIKGTVDQLSYGSPMDIEKYIASYVAFGLLGVGSSAKSDKEKRAGFVEYRFKVYKLPDEKFLDSFIIQGAHSSSISGRQEIIKKANEIVTEELVYQLNNKIAKHFRKQPKKYFIY